MVTSDAEILFLRTDGSLVHGEDIQVCPTTHHTQPYTLLLNQVPQLHINRYWFRSNSSQSDSLLRQSDFTEGKVAKDKTERTDPR